MKEFNLKCKNCNEIFISKSLRKINCNKCQEELMILAKNKCSICKEIVKKRDQNGRGYDCGCHNKWYKEHFDKINYKRKGPGKCLNCNEFSLKRDGRGFCSKCVGKAMINRKSSGNCIICGKFNKERDQYGYVIVLKYFQRKF